MALAPSDLYFDLAAKYQKEEKGISWQMQGGRQRIEKDLSIWMGKRGGAGKLVPNGFPRPPIFNK